MFVLLMHAERNTCIHKLVLKMATLANLASSPQDWISGLLIFSKGVINTSIASPCSGVSANGRIFKNAETMRQLTTNIIIVKVFTGLTNGVQVPFPLIRSTFCELSPSSSSGSWKGVGVFRYYPRLQYQVNLTMPYLTKWNSFNLVWPHQMIELTVSILRAIDPGSVVGRVTFKTFKK